MKGLPPAELEEIGRLIVVVIGKLAVTFFSPPLTGSVEPSELINHECCLVRGDFRVRRELDYIAAGRTF